MKKLHLLLFVFFLVAIAGNAQKRRMPPNRYPEPKMSIGMGLGLDYGVTGIRPTYRFFPNAEVFVGLGYNVFSQNNFGYNAGATARLFAKARVTPTLSIMYGRNAFLKFVGNYQYPSFDKAYDGVSAAVGMQIRFNSGNFLNLGIIIPNRSEEFQKDFDYIRKVSTVLIEPSPITLSIGFHSTVF